MRSAVVLTKQFSHLLGSAADPYKALVHFNSLMDRFDQDAVFTRYSSLLQNPVVLRNLARVLGAGDFLWEEFLRLGYGNVLPLLADRPAAGDGGAARGAVTTRAAFRAGLTARLREARTPEARRLALNEFKDFEIFKADLQYLLDPYMTQDAHAAVLSNLAEAVVETAALCAEEEMRQEYGEPRNVAGRPCTYALMALGKLGGRELGYASDLELLTVFSGRGATAGPRQIPADEYFVRLVERLRDMIQARRQGIFEVDLRLRPHGGNGPLAVGFESFCHYYANRGEALDYERQALIKMRFLSGDRGLGERLESFRDESLYHSREVRYEAIDDVRRRQHRELAGGDCLNAKFSAGGLVDVEYAVQFLQILNGTAAPNLRTPNTQDALRALGEAGVLMPAESGALHEAYAFLRRLVNALRMLRGHAKDLEIPPFESLEFCHLARRMGYRPRPGLPVAAQLRGELGGHMAYVRDFCRRRFGRPLLITRETGNLADVALTPELSEDVVAGILARNGFQNVSRAAYNLRQLLGESGAERDVFSQLIVLAEPLFRASADADMALNNWERYAGAVISRHGFHESLLREPQQLEIFLNIVAASQFLADVLTRNPECFSWVLEPQELLHPKTREGLAREIAEETMGLRQPEHALNALRRCRRRQLLRIGTRDLCLGVPFTETVADLSWLAAGVVDAVVTLESRHLPQAAALLQDGRLCILALGKLGGAELNYSSDVDLLAYLDDAAAAVSASDLEAASELLRQSIRSLTAATPQGHMYRIDMRLRPFGSQGALVGRLSSLRRYYETQARPWEVQALLKARAVRGEAARAQSLVADLVRGSLERWEYAAFERDALRARRTHLQAQGAEGAELDIKTGPGGIRSIEFGVQLLQLRHLRAHPELFEANTLAAISHLVDLDIVPLGQAAELSGAYLLLRRVEHLLQIMDDRQVHALRRTPEVLRAVGRRLLFQVTTPESVWSAIDGARQTSARFFAQVTGG